MDTSMIDNIQQQIDNHKNEIEKLQTEMNNIKSMNPTEQLAIFLHDSFCKDNHTDGCGWHYAARNGKHDWSQSEHVRYLNKAKAMIALGYDMNQIVEILRCL